MYRLLIVDDEEIIADGLNEVFQSRKEFELDVYKAYSGIDALNILNKVRIDIVLTDIRMPGMSGLELLEKIHDSWPKCKVIFLTGYNEFDFVYTAIQHEGVSYILKTEGYSKIIKMVGNAVTTLEKSLMAQEVLQKAKEQIGTTIELLQKDYLLGVLRGEYSKSEINQRQFNELEIPLKSELPVIILLGRVENLDKGISYSEKSRLFFSIKLLAEKYLNSHTWSVHFVDENKNFIWLIQPNKMRKDGEDGELWIRTLTFIKGNLELVQAACKESVSAILSFALDDCPVRWEVAIERFTTLKMMLNYRIGQVSGMLFTDKSIVEKDLLVNSSEGEIEKLYLSQTKLDMLSQYLEHGQKEEFSKTFKELTINLKRVKSILNNYAQESFYSIGLIFLTYINRWNLSEKINLKIRLSMLMKVNVHENWHNAVEFLDKLGDIIFNEQHIDQDRRAEDAISRVKNHIKDNIHNQDELSLMRLAELVFFNPSYLSRLFKQVSGTNLTEYIWKVRIKRAEELLGNIDIKIHEVAEAVGYDSPTNFSRFFKKLTNTTPQEYREVIISKRLNRK